MYLASLMIYHLAEPERWEAALEAEQEVYTHPSLHEEGFIHCSTKDEVLESARLFFADYDALYVLAIIDKRVKNHLRWVEVPERGAHFPHVHAGIPFSAIETVYMVTRQADGTFAWDD